MTYKYFLVGGAVRDQLLGIKSKDLDYAVEAPDFDSMVAWIKERGEKVYLAQPEFWTARATKGADVVDYVLCRKDGKYSDGRRPDTVEPGTIWDDLARRDFTVNAMAIDQFTGILVDPFGGQVDLDRKRLNCVGDPKDRFSEDALRMLRALRFAITKGFTISYIVDTALRNNDLIEKLRTNISMDRKKDELMKMMRHSTLATLKMLETYPGIRDVVFSDADILWLEPTTRKK